MVSQPTTFLEKFNPTLLGSLAGLSLKARYVMEGYLSGLHRSPFHGFSVEFSDYQRYQPGDDLRHLDWRLFARSDRLCIRRYMQETNLRFYVVLDCSGSMEYRGGNAWGSKFDCAKVLAAAVTWFLLRQNDAGGMLTQEGAGEVPYFIRPSQKPSQLGLLLSELDGLQAAGGACLAALLEHAARLIHRRSLVLFLSDLLEPPEEVARGFKQLRFNNHEIVVLQVLDRDEMEFPFEEGVLFEDLEIGSRRRVASNGNARAKYLERFNEFMAAHRANFQAMEIPHCVVRTDQDPSQALAMFFRARGKLL